MPKRHRDRTLRVDPIKCEGHALCIEAFPEMINADPWNYPVLSPDPIPPHLLHHAEHAVKLCPVLALRIVAGEHPGRPPRGPEVPSASGRGRKSG